MADLHDKADTKLFSASFFENYVSSNRWNHEDEQCTNPHLGIMCVTGFVGHQLFSMCAKRFTKSDDLKEQLDTYQRDMTDRNAYELRYPEIQTT